MTREEAIARIKIHKDVHKMDEPRAIHISEALDMAIEALKQESKVGWNNHQIACMLEDLFGDACACNYNGIDEWLSELCDFKDTCCPNPVGVACWEQFLKHSQSRYTECEYETRDKGALQESVLDKIRTEIENHCGLIKENHCKYCSSCNCLIGVREILETIDKYKESEDEE